MKQILQISCSQCDSFLLTYRKDGAGTLLKIYLDRIIDTPVEMHIPGIQEKSRMSPFVCPKCQNTVGVPMLDPSNNRLAYRVIRGSIKKTKKV
jgi:hypothetical protein